MDAFRSEERATRHTSLHKFSESMVLMGVTGSLLACRHVIILGGGKGHDLNTHEVAP